RREARAWRPSPSNSIATPPGRARPKAHGGTLDLDQGCQQVCLSEQRLSGKGIQLASIRSTSLRGLHQLFWKLSSHLDALRCAASENGVSLWQPLYFCVREGLDLVISVLGGPFSVTLPKK
ncbi:mCG145917, isoform CRA_b, partial [Mus musculus]